MRRQLERTRTIVRDTIDHQDEAWRAFANAVGDTEELADLDPTPQAGLVPLGPDRTSGHHEFALAASGSIPTRDSGTGRLEIDAVSAAVVVLLPGGEFVAGEGPTRRSVILTPFLIGKHEITQAQWLRVMERNRSVYQPGHAKVEITPLHPVENITWHEANTFAARLGMALPSEAQWEYACLAGGSGRFAWQGDAETALRGRANIADQSLRSVDLPHATWSDGYPVTAPIARFAINAFGLHDMHGNVCEWCADQFETQSHLARLLVPGDGVTITATDPRRVFKGGSWYLRPQHAHARMRHRLPPNQSNSNLGVRVARQWTSRL